MRPLVGYLVDHPDGLRGAPGLAYDYVLAGNGLLVRGEKVTSDGTPLLRAAVPVAEAPVRGLVPLEPFLELPQGKVPLFLWEKALALFRLRPDLEMYLAVRWENGEYRLEMPQQETTPGSVTYTPLPETVVDIHSHGTMGARFSNTDDADDRGFRVSIVVGRLDHGVPEVAARVSLYGCRWPVGLSSIFG